MLLLTAAAGMAHATVSFSLNPADGAVSGLPGATVGWGFTMADDQYFLIVTATGFCSTFDPASDSLPCQSPTNPPVANGTYADYFGGSPFNFYLSAPGSPDLSQQNFDAVAQTGTGAFTIDDNAALIGQILTGVVVVDYNLYSCDPTDITCTSPVEQVNPVNSSFDFFAVADASVQVTPEPATYVSVLSGVLIVVLRRRSKARD
ncbi:MAG: PEP-CTERM sorting domain-containing protein [Acidobacteriia bacterium]|nr:PEP-CTERM sorting domain-containing protein [Terriglobia bacterium]